MVPSDVRNRIFYAILSSSRPAAPTNIKYSSFSLPWKYLVKNIFYEAAHHPDVSFHYLFPLS
jgi:hypothetical protein